MSPTWEGGSSVIQRRGLANVSLPNQAVDTRRRAPGQSLGAAEVGYLDFSYSCHGLLLRRCAAVAASRVLRAEVLGEVVDQCRCLCPLTEPLLLIKFD